MLAGMSDSNAQRRCNIVLLVAEDTGRHHGCYGDPMRVTPNIDGLAAQGCRFDNAISTAPVCAPSRSSLITGQFPIKIGTHHMRSTLLHPPRLFTEALREAGYHVNWTNKTDFNFDPPPGWVDESSDWISELEQGRKPESPFFHFCNFQITHESGMWPHEAWPSWREPAASLGQTFASLAVDPARVPVPPYIPDLPATRAELARYYQNLAYQDHQVGRALAALETAGVADNTLVIYLADHGCGALREKRWLYEAGIHVPLVMRWPGRICAGSVREDLVSWVDIAPTILSAAGAEAMKDLDGRVLLGDRTGAEPPCVFAARDRMDEVFDRARAARDRRFLYIRNFFPQLPHAQRSQYMEKMPSLSEIRRLHAAGALASPADLFFQTRRSAEELFDAIADPHCLNNLAGDERFGEPLGQLRGRLDEWIARTGDLGAVSEGELIARGLVKDRREEYRQRIEPLPPELRFAGPVLAPLEMSEVQD